MISNILDVSSTVLFVVAFYQVFDVTCPFSVLALCMPIGLFFSFPYIHAVAYLFKLLLIGDSGVGRS